MRYFSMRLIKKLSALIFVPFLASCVAGDTMLVSDKTTAIGSVSNMTSTELSFSFQKCDGVSIYSFKIKEENSTSIKTSVTVESGSISFKITDSDKVEVYNEKLEESKKYEINVEKPGKYRIEITHNQFKGKYKLNWAK